MLGSRLLQAEVVSLEDVYWLEDSRALQLTGKDFPLWSAARQTLPTSKDQLERFKSELWSAVVKESQHEDAWTWGELKRHRTTLRVSSSYRVAIPSFPIKVIPTKKVLATPVERFNSSSSFQCSLRISY